MPLINQLDLLSIAAGDKDRALYVEASTLECYTRCPGFPKQIDVQGPKKVTTFLRTKINRDQDNDIVDVVYESADGYSIHVQND